MQVWHILNEQEAKNFDSLEFKVIGKTLHPVTSKPYALMVDKYNRDRIVLVPEEYSVTYAEIISVATTKKKRTYKKKTKI